MQSRQLYSEQQVILWNRRANAVDKADALKGSDEFRVMAHKSYVSNVCSTSPDMAHPS